VKPPILADAIVDVSETGSSLRANQLEVLDTVLETTPRFFANREALGDPWKRSKIDIAMSHSRFTSCRSACPGAWRRLPK
jgi:ATP phosphoribosyltransferase